MQMIDKHLVSLLIELELIDSWLQEMYSRILEGEALCHHAIELFIEGSDCRGGSICS